MRLDRIDGPDPSLSFETRAIGILRACHAGGDAMDAVRETVLRDLRPERAAACIDGAAAVLALLRQHGWHGPVLLGPDARGRSEDEGAIARMIRAATEQDRDRALAEASFLVSPVALLPMLQAAQRFGLPLLCADCHARIRGAATAGRLTLQ